MGILDMQSDARMPCIANFDGACGPVNPGGTASWGWIAKTPEGTVERHGLVGHGHGMTNNVAEYCGLIDLLRWIRDNRPANTWEVRGDSAMVVKMASGEWGRKNPHKSAPHLKPYVLEARTILAALPGIRLKWIPREENAEADALSNVDQP